MEGVNFTSLREQPPAIRTVGSVSDNFIHCVGVRHKRGNSLKMLFF